MDTGKDWYWQQGSPDISQDSSGVKLLSTDTLVVTYTGQYPTVILTQNGAQITYQQSLDNTTGIVEEVEQNNTLASSDSAYDLASTLLNRYAAQGVQLQFNTLSSVFAPGQLITVNLPQHGIYNAQMLIEEVSASDQQDGLNIWYTLKAISGPYDITWIDFFSKLLKNQQIAASINVGVSQTVPLLQTFEGGVTLSGTLTATAYSCPLPSTTLFPSLTLYPC